MREKEKKGQVTIFIIIGLVVVAAGVLIYFMFPGIRSSFGVEEETPYEFIDNCLDEDFIQEKISQISARGGSLDPEHYIVYKGENVEYLCYTNEDYLPCVVQQPLIKRHVEREIEAAIRDDANRCLDAMESEYESKGYDVDLRRGGVIVELLPDRVVIRFDTTLILNKDGNSQNYNLFRVVLNNNLYELVAIASSIVSWETAYGDAETAVYMTYYRNIKVEKKIQVEGTTIYIITERDTGNYFQFASRSVVWPPGYG